MTKRLVLVFLFLLLLPSVQLAQTSRTGKAAGTSGTLIGYISSSHIGPGCYFGLRRNASIDDELFSNNGEGTSAWMNIGGQEVELRRVGASRKYGDLYKAADISVRIRTWVTKRPKDEESEVSEWAGTITVTKGTRRQRVNVVGECGS